jgi:hypothetical protein
MTAKSRSGYRAIGPVDNDRGNEMNTLQRRDATYNEHPSAHATRGSASVDTRRIHLVIRGSDRVPRVSACPRVPRHVARHKPRAYIL